MFVNKARSPNALDITPFKRATTTIGTMETASGMSDWEKVFSENKTLFCLNVSKNKEMAQAYCEMQ
jgi:hypothetical protein